MWVSPFRYPWIVGYVLLPMAFRSLSRLSSALSAKASTLCSFLLNLWCIALHRLRVPVLWKLLFLRFHSHSGSGFDCFVYLGCLLLFVSLRSSRNASDVFEYSAPSPFGSRPPGRKRFFTDIVFNMRFSRYVVTEILSVISKLNLY